MKLIFILQYYGLINDFTILILIKIILILNNNRQTFYKIK